MWNRSILNTMVLSTLLISQLAMAAPQESNDRGIRFLSGGIGQSEMEEIRQISKNYNLNLLFVTTAGNYLSDVDVRISTRSGKEMFATVSRGPYLLAELPVGKYTLEATADGKTIQRQVDIVKGQRSQLDLRWPGNVAVTGEPK